MYIYSIERGEKMIHLTINIPEIITNIIVPIIPSLAANLIYDTYKKQTIKIVCFFYSL